LDAFASRFISRRGRF